MLPFLRATLKAPKPIPHYPKELNGEKIRHMTKVWNDSFGLKQLGWV